MNLSLDPGRTRPRATSLLSRGAAGAAAAAVAAAGLWWTATSVGDDLVVTPPGQETGPVPVVAAIGAALVAGAGATAVAAVLAHTRRVVRPRRWFLAVSTIALLLSFASPFGAAEGTSSALWLSAMHLAVAGAVVPLLAGALPRRTR